MDLQLIIEGLRMIADGLEAGEGSKIAARTNASDGTAPLDRVLTKVMRLHSSGSH